MTFFRRFDMTNTIKDSKTKTVELTLNAMATGSTKSVEPMPNAVDTVKKKPFYDRYIVAIWLGMLVISAISYEMASGIQSELPITKIITFSVPVTFVLVRWMLGLSIYPSTYPPVDWQPGDNPLKSTASSGWEFSDSNITYDGRYTPVAGDFHGHHS